MQLGSVLNMAKRKVDEQKEQYEQMAAEDRELDKSFRRDFADCDPYVDQLYKLFRKRPRWVRCMRSPVLCSLLPAILIMFSFDTPPLPCTQWPKAKTWAQ